MYDLSACIEACLKVIIAMFYFCHSNHSSNTMKNYIYIYIYIYNLNQIYFWEKISSLTNITNKCVIRKKNLQKSIKFGCKDIICFDIGKMKGRLGRVSPSHFLQNLLIGTSCFCFKNF